MYLKDIVIILIFFILFSNPYSIHAIETLEEFLASNDIKLEFNPTLEDSKLRLIDPVFNGLEFVGNIQNTGNDHIIIKDTLFTFYDPLGNRIISFTKFSSEDMFSNYLKPGEISPFKFDIGLGILRQIAEAFKVKIDLDVKIMEEIKKEEKLEFNNILIHQDFGYLKLSGEIINNGNYTVDLTDVKVAIYDSNDQIIDTETAHIQPNTLEPKESGSFEVIISRVSETDNDYVNLFVDGDKYSMIKLENNITVKMNKLY